MVALYQFAITLGILCAYFANALALKLSGTLTFLHPEGVLYQVFVSEVWRAMFGWEIVPALIFLIIMFFVPSSPRWLAAKNKNEKALKVLKLINSEDMAKSELESIK